MEEQLDEVVEKGKKYLEENKYQKLKDGLEESDVDRIMSESQMNMLNQVKKQNEEQK